MRPLFKLSWAIIEVRPGPDMAPTIKPQVEDLNRSIFHLTQDRNDLRRGNYLNLHTFVSFKLPIATDNDHKITMLLQKSEKRSKKKQV